MNTIEIEQKKFISTQAVENITYEPILRLLLL